LISYLATVSTPLDEKIPHAPRSDLSNNSTTIAARPQETPKITAALPTPGRIEVKIEPRSIPVKIDVSHGFIPDPITINISDTIVWINEENLRPRVVLVSRDGLFENQLLQDYDRYQYQFNRSGKYTFALTEYGTYKEYSNATGSVIVR
jgi:plastocyanin